MLKTLVLLTCLAGAAQLPAAAQVGQAAPEFSLPDQDGAVRSLSQYKGKTVVLEWLNQGCPFVRKHYRSGSMQGLQREAAGKGVVWLSIVSSAPGKEGYWAQGSEAAAFKQEQKAAMSAILLDPQGAVGRAYGAKTTPHMYIIDAKGVLAYAGAIDSIRSVKPKDIPKAKNYVRQALAELAAGKPVSEAQTKAYGCSVKYAD